MALGIVLPLVCTISTFITRPNLFRLINNISISNLMFVKCSWWKKYRRMCRKVKWEDKNTHVLLTTGSPSHIICNLCHINLTLNIFVRQWWIQNRYAVGKININGRIMNRRCPTLNTEPAKGTLTWHCTYRKPLTFHSKANCVFHETNFQISSAFTNHVRF